MVLGWGPQSLLKLRVKKCHSYNQRNKDAISPQPLRLYSLHVRPEYTPPVWKMGLEYYGYLTTPQGPLKKKTVATVLDEASFSPDQENMAQGMLSLDSSHIIVNHSGCFYLGMPLTTFCACAVHF